MGRRVRVKFLRRSLVGVVTALTDAPEAPSRPLRPLEKVLDPAPAIAPALLDILREEAEHVLCPLGLALAAALPPGSLPRAASALAATARGREALRAGAAQGELRRLLERLAKGPRSAPILRRAGFSARDAPPLRRGRPDRDADPRAPRPRAPGRGAPGQRAPRGRGPAADAHRRAGGGLRGDRRAHRRARGAPLPAPRRHRQRQDRGLPARDRAGARARAPGARAGARDHAHPPDHRPAARALRRPRWPCSTAACAPASASRSGSACVAARRRSPSARARPSSRRSTTSASS